ncbi:MAG: hypothetical protein AB7N76_20620 [Planctomycetota bacterium]
MRRGRILERARDELVVAAEGQPSQAQAAWLDGHLAAPAVDLRVTLVGLVASASQRGPELTVSTRAAAERCTLAGPLPLCLRELEDRGAGLLVLLDALGGPLLRWGLRRARAPVLLVPATCPAWPGTTDPGRIAAPVGRLVLRRPSDVLWLARWTRVLPPWSTFELALRPELDRYQALGALRDLDELEGAAAWLSGVLRARGHATRRLPGALAGQAALRAVSVIFDAPAHGWARRFLPGSVERALRLDPTPRLLVSPSTAAGRNGP